MLFEPVNKMGVVCIFSIHHAELRFPYIVKISPPYPDAFVIGDDEEPKRTEFEYRSYNFHEHGHGRNLASCDNIVCWEYNWPDAPKDIREKIFVLKDRIEEI